MGSYLQFLNGLMKGSVGSDSELEEPFVADVSVTVDAFGMLSGFAKVGSGSVTSSSCGKHMRFDGCSKVDLHKVVVDNVDYSGMSYMTNVVMSCGKPSCSKCYRLGWAPRLAWKISGRLLWFSKLLAETNAKTAVIEHVVCSIPPADYWITDYDVMRARAVKALKLRGVIGGNLIFHATRQYGHTTREHRKGEDFFSPHWHCLSFILGGYGCRGCKKVCGDCNGFEGVVRRMRLVDGYVVKIAVDRETGVAGERESIGGTAWYQLHHAAYKKGVDRFHVSTYFGICSYNKQKVVVPVFKRVCPLCGSELVQHFYVGKRRFSDLCSRKPSSGACRHGSVEGVFEDGVRVWVEAVGGSHASV
jgi:hypothetical protein